MPLPPTAPHVGGASAAHVGAYPDPYFGALRRERSAQPYSGQTFRFRMKIVRQPIHAQKLAVRSFSSMPGKANKKAPSSRSKRVAPEPPWPVSVSAESHRSQGLSSMHAVPSLPPAPMATPPHRLMEALRRNVLFRSALSDDQLASICAGVVELRVANGDVVVRQAEQGDHIFVVESGRFEERLGDAVQPRRGSGREAIKKERAERRRFARGDTFGQLALLHSCERPGTIRCVSRRGGTLWVLSRRDVCDAILPPPAPDAIEGASDEGVEVAGPVSAFSRVAAASPTHGRRPPATGVRRPRHRNGCGRNRGSSHGDGI